MSLSSVFKNGGPNFSFGRTFSGIVILVGLVVMCIGVYSDYRKPVMPIQMSRFDMETKTAYVETQLVPKPDWGGYQTFMIGIATLAGGVYGLSKFGEAAKSYADNSGT